MRKPLLLVAALATLICSQARAWGDLGHEIIALIAYRHLVPAARAALDALLADLERACFGFPAVPAGQWASLGPAQDCVVNKIDEFAAELKSPSTPAAERILALKFLIHFMGDLHQPLHAADHHDRGGNCISLSPPFEAQNNLHAYWDVSVVNALGHSAAQIAEQLDARLSAGDIKAWTQGSPQTWAMDTFEIGRRDTYALPETPTCQSGGSVALTPAYRAQAEKDVAAQLEKAAVRLAAVLNGALGQ